MMIFHVARLSWLVAIVLCWSTTCGAPAYHVHRVYGVHPKTLELPVYHHHNLEQQRPACVAVEIDHQALQESEDTAWFYRSHDGRQRRADGGGTYGIFLVTLADAPGSCQSRRRLNAIIFDNPTICQFDRLSPAILGQIAAGQTQEELAAEAAAAAADRNASTTVQNTSVYVVPTPDHPNDFNQTVFRKLEPGSMLLLRIDPRHSCEYLEGYVVIDLTYEAGTMTDFYVWSSNRQADQFSATLTHRENVTLPGRYDDAVTLMIWPTQGHLLLAVSSYSLAKCHDSEHVVYNSVAQLMEKASAHWFDPNGHSDEWCYHNVTYTMAHVEGVSVGSDQMPLLALPYSWSCSSLPSNDQYFPVLSFNFSTTSGLIGNQIDWLMSADVVGVAYGAGLSPCNHGSHMYMSTAPSAAFSTCVDYLWAVPHHGEGVAPWWKTFFRNAHPHTVTVSSSTTADLETEQLQAYVFNAEPPIMKICSAVEDCQEPLVSALGPIPVDDGIYGIYVEAGQVHWHGVILPKINHGRVVLTRRSMLIVEILPPFQNVLLVAYRRPEYMGNLSITILRHDNVSQTYHLKPGAQWYPDLIDEDDSCANAEPISLYRFGSYAHASSDTMATSTVQAVLPVNWPSSHSTGYLYRLQLTHSSGTPPAMSWSSNPEGGTISTTAVNPTLSRADVAVVGTAEHRPQHATLYIQGHALDGIQACQHHPVLTVPKTLPAGNGQIPAVPESLDFSNWMFGEIDVVTYAANGTLEYNSTVQVHMETTNSNPDSIPNMVCQQSAHDTLVNCTTGAWSFLRLPLLEYTVDVVMFEYIAVSPQTTDYWGLAVVDPNNTLHSYVSSATTLLISLRPEQVQHIFLVSPILPHEDGALIASTYTGDQLQQRFVMRGQNIELSHIVGPYNDAVLWANTTESCDLHCARYGLTCADMNDMPPVYAPDVMENLVGGLSAGQCQTTPTCLDTSDVSSVFATGTTEVNTTYSTWDGCAFTGLTRYTCNATFGPCCCQANATLRHSNQSLGHCRQEVESVTPRHRPVYGVDIWNTETLSHVNGNGSCVTVNTSMAEIVYGSCAVESNEVLGQPGTTTTQLYTRDVVGVSVNLSQTTQMPIMVLQSDGTTLSGGEPMYNLTLSDVFLPEIFFHDHSGSAGHIKHGQNVTLAFANTLLPESDSYTLLHGHMDDDISTVCTRTVTASTDNTTETEFDWYTLLQSTSPIGNITTQLNNQPKTADVYTFNDVSDDSIAVTIHHLVPYAAAETQLQLLVMGWLDIGSDWPISALRYEQDHVAVVGVVLLNANATDGTTGKSVSIMGPGTSLSLSVHDSLSYTHFAVIVGTPSDQPPPAFDQLSIYGATQRHDMTQTQWISVINKDTFLQCATARDETSTTLGYWMKKIESSGKWCGTFNVKDVLYGSCASQRAVFEHKILFMPLGTINNAVRSWPNPKETVFDMSQAETAIRLSSFDQVKRKQHRIRFYAQYLKQDENITMCYIRTWARKNKHNDPINWKSQIEKGKKLSGNFNVDLKINGHPRKTHVTVKQASSSKIHYWSTNVDATNPAVWKELKGHWTVFFDNIHLQGTIISEGALIHPEGVEPMAWGLTFKKSKKPELALIFRKVSSYIHFDFNPVEGSSQLTPFVVLPCKPKVSGNSHEQIKFTLYMTTNYASYYIDFKLYCKKDSRRRRELTNAPYVQAAIRDYQCPSI